MLKSQKAMEKECKAFGLALGNAMGDVLKAFMEQVAIHTVNGSGGGKKKRKRDPDQKREPSAYNDYMSVELKRVKAANPGMAHKDAFAAVAASWATSDKNPKVPGSSAAIAKATSALAPVPVTAEEPVPVPEESPKKKQKKDKKKKASPAASPAPAPVSEEEAKKQRKAEKKRKKKEAAARAAAEAAN